MHPKEYIQKFIFEFKVLNNCTFSTEWIYENDWGYILILSDLPVDTLRNLELPKNIDLVPVNLLILMHKQLDIFPKALYELTGLKTMYFSRCPLTQTPDMRPFSNLETIEMMKNKMDEFDFSLLPRDIERVSVGNSQLSKLKFAKLEKLKILELYKNNIAELPDIEEIQSYFPVLEELNIQKNPISHMQKGELKIKFGDNLSFYED